MAQVSLRKVVKTLRRRRGGARHRPRHRRQGVRRAGRPVGLRQVDDAAHDRRARGDHRRRDRDRRRGRQRRAAEGPRHRDGVPELRALPAHDGVREHVVRAAAASNIPKAEIEQPRAGGRAHPRHRRAARPQAASSSPAASASASRWAARSCAIPKVFLFDEPLSNLDAKLRVQMRTEIKKRAPEGAHHDRLRHPRPGRGDDARRPRGGDERAAGSSRSARRTSSITRPRRASSPASSARRR